MLFSLRHARIFISFIPLPLKKPRLIWRVGPSCQPPAVLSSVFLKAHLNNESRKEHINLPHSRREVGECSMKMYVAFETMKFVSFAANCEYVFSIAWMAGVVLSQTVICHLRSQTQDKITDPSAAEHGTIY